MLLLQEENTSTKSNSVASRGSCDSRTGDVAISNRGQDLDLVKTLATKFMVSSVTMRRPLEFVETTR